MLRSYGLNKSIDAADDTIIAGTLLGSIFVFAPISRYDLIYLTLYIIISLVFAEYKIRVAFFFTK